MKALELLKQYQYADECLNRLMSIELIESIRELEELNNRSCLNCIFAYRDKNKKIDDVQGQILGSKARWSYCKKLMLNITKDFCCNRYESKEIVNV